MQFQHAFRLTIVALVAIPTAHLKAATLPPAGLTNGQQYEVLFATADGITASSTDITVYNAFVNTEATPITALLPVGVIWNAVVSTPTVNAATNAPSSSSIPIYNQDGQLLTNTGLYSGDPLVGPVFNQNNLSNGGLIAWTGTNPDGTGDATFELGGSSGLTVVDGDITTPDWLNSGGAFNNTPEEGFTGVLLALSSPITVSGVVAPMPEPSSLVAICGLGAMGLFFAVRRRRGA